VEQCIDIGGSAFEQAPGGGSRPKPLKWLRVLKLNHRRLPPARDDFQVLEPPRRARRNVKLEKDDDNAKSH
jgi:hypothetical protein